MGWLKKFLIFAMFLIAPVCWAEEAEDKTITGTIVDLDWVSSTITVLYSDPYTGQNDEINLKVASDANMHRGTESISFSDLLQSDPVTVTYYSDGVGGLKVKRLSDQNLAEL